MNPEQINRLCDVVGETSFAIHRYPRHGHVEKVYENALLHRLLEQGVRVVAQYPLAVHDEDGTVLGEFYADLMVEEALVVEFKAVRAIADEHVAQLLGYLHSSRTQTGLLINFGSPIMSVKKYLMNRVA